MGPFKSSKIRPQDIMVATRGPEIESCSHREPEYRYYAGGLIMSEGRGPRIVSSCFQEGRGFWPEVPFVQPHCASRLFIEFLPEPAMKP
jgi:hypothetical protein